MQEKIAEILAQEGLEITEITLELEENINHPEFGQPERITVAAKKLQISESRTGQVANVEIDLGRPAARSANEGVVSGRIERLIGKQLGVGVEKIEVKVLSDN